MRTLYQASWSFRLRLILPPNGTDADVKQVLDRFFCPAMPARITNIEACFKDLSAACYASSDPASHTLAVEGYIQHTKGINLYHLDQWVPNTEWTHVGGRLIDNDDYKKYKASKEDTTVYIHQQIHGMPAIGKGGSKQKPGKVFVAPRRAHAPLRCAAPLSALSCLAQLFTELHDRHMS
jgi:hypothetical protein